MRFRKGTHYRYKKSPEKRRLRIGNKDFIAVLITLPLVTFLSSGIYFNLYQTKFDHSSLDQPTSSTSTYDPILLEDDQTAYNSDDYENDLNDLLYNLGDSDIDFDYNNIDFYSGSNSDLYEDYLSDRDNFCSTSCTLYDRSGGFITLSCYEYLNSCTIRDSYGNRASTNCYEYLNSCTTRTSDGDYYNTNCYEYINSCDTYGPDGYSNSTNCYEYLNSCTTRDSYGNSYDTTCYEYLNSCSTRGSDGSYSNTYSY